MGGSRANFLHKPTCIGQISPKNYGEKWRRMANFSHDPTQILQEILRNFLPFVAIGSSPNELASLCLNLTLLSQLIPYIFHLCNTLQTLSSLVTKDCTSKAYVNCTCWYPGKILGPPGVKRCFESNEVHAIKK